MPYKTLVLEILEQHPTLFQQLKANRLLLLAINRCALTLQEAHQTWMLQLAQKDPRMDRYQQESRGLELALAGFREDMQRVSKTSDTPLSLEAAMEFLCRHTPSGY